MKELMWAPRSGSMIDLKLMVGQRSELVMALELELCSWLTKDCYSMKELDSELTMGCHSRKEFHWEIKMDCYSTKESRWEHQTDWYSTREIHLEL